MRMTGYVQGCVRVRQSHYKKDGGTMEISHGWIRLPTNTERIEIFLPYIFQHKTSTPYKFNVLSYNGNWNIIKGWQQTCSITTPPSAYGWSNEELVLFPIIACRGKAGTKFKRFGLNWTVMQDGNWAYSLKIIGSMPVDNYTKMGNVYFIAYEKLHYWLAQALETEQANS